MTEDFEGEWNNKEGVQGYTWSSSKASQIVTSKDAVRSVETCRQAELVDVEADDGGVVKDNDEQVERATERWSRVRRDALD